MMVREDDNGVMSPLPYLPPLSPRLAAVVHALPLRPGMRVLEIGCGPGAAARAVLARLGGTGHVLAIDRSAKAVAQAVAGSGAELATGRLVYRQVAAEALVLDAGEPRYDLAFAIRVGALDGRHPEAGRLALQRIAQALVPGGRLFIDGGSPLREVDLPRLSTPPGAPPRRAPGTGLRASSAGRPPCAR